MAIFINGFDFGTSEQAIMDHFDPVGKVSDVKFVGNGGAVVRFDNPDAASQAVSEMDNTTIDGNRRYINVKMDGEKGSKGGGKRDRKGGGKDSGYGDRGDRYGDRGDRGDRYADRDRGYGGGGKGGGGKRGGGKGDYEDRTTYSGNMQTGAIFINGFDFGTSEQAITDHFDSVGKVSDIKFVGNGGAVVRFDNPDAASQAVSEMDGTTIDGNRRYINVKMDGEKGSKGGGKGGGGKRDGGKGDYEDRTTYSGDMQTGVVAKFLTDRGFGYITPDEGGNDLFVHFSAICGDGFRELSEGQRVEFGAEPDPKGKGKGKEAMRAVAVSII